jgi:prepilin-type N-terminal cleavage/methylation domain-containing protein
MQYRGNTQGELRAFSLVEMLVVIAVIALIAAIAVPTMGSIISKSERNVSRRTAQILVSTAEGAVGAGSQEVAAAVNEGDALDILSNGVNGAGLFSDVVFRVPLNAEEKAKVDAYLSFEGGRLIFDSSGSSGS